MSLKYYDLDPRNWRVDAWLVELFPTGYSQPSPFWLSSLYDITPSLSPDPPWVSYMVKKYWIKPRKMVLRNSGESLSHYICYLIWGGSPRYPFGGVQQGYSCKTPACPAFISTSTPCGVAWSCETLAQGVLLSRCCLTEMGKSILKAAGETLQSPV